MTSSVRFLKKFLDSPASIGSIVPSSQVLVASLMELIDWRQARVLVELGAGTGVVTCAIDSHRAKDSTFISFEKDDQMRQALQGRLPGVVTATDAFHLPQELQRLGLAQADCILSCLPFSNFTRHEQAHLLNMIHAALRPGATFIAFQYSLKLQGRLEALYGEVTNRFVMRNIPPAFIYVCRKQVQ